MQNFNLEKKGYNKEEVKNTIETLVKDYEQKLSEQKDRIFALRREIEDLKDELIKYKSKDKNVSSALIAAVETAQEIEKSSKDIYNLEINRIRLLYTKWGNFLKELVDKYPQMKDNFDTQGLLESFKKSIDQTMQENFNTMKTTKSNNTILARQGVQNLLYKMGGSPHVVKNKYFTTNTENFSDIKEDDNIEPIYKEIPQKTLTLKRQEIDSVEILETTKAKNDLMFENKRLKEAKSNIKPITNLTLNQEDRYSNLVDKYLEANSLESDEFANTAYAKQLTKKNSKKKQPDYLAYLTPNETGFDLKQALNPTEELAEIMKVFDFFEGDKE